MVWSGGEELGEEVSDRRWKLIEDDDGTTHRMRVEGGALFRTTVTAAGATVFHSALAA
jgi:hypothetical protein